jgi:hypothetical protein
VAATANCRCRAQWERTQESFRRCSASRSVGGAEMGAREWARWVEKQSETTTSVGAPGNLAMRRTAASAHGTNSALLIVYEEGAAGGCDDAGGSRRGKEGATAGGHRTQLPRSVSHSLALGRRRDSAADETRVQRV